MLNFLKKHCWIVIVIFLLLLFPQSLSDQARLNMRVIITGIGVDYKDNNYVITSQVVLPASGSESGGISAHINYVSAEGESISDGVQKVSQKIGKIAELSHIEFILVGKTMQKQNIASALDYFFRNYKLKNSVMILSCASDAMQEIQKTSSLELGVALGMQKVYLSNENSLNGVAKSYVEFINDSYSVSGTSVLDTFQIITSGESEDSSKDQTGGQSSGGQDSSSNSQGQNSQKSSSSQSSGGSGGSSESGSSGSQSSNNSGQSSSGGSQGGNIAIQTPLHLYKKGMYVGQIDDKDGVLGYYYSSKKSKSGNIFITNFSFAEAQNANINLQIDNMKKHHKIKYVNGLPVHQIDITITDSRIDEIASCGLNNTELYKTLDPLLQSKITQTASKKIEGLVYKTFEIAKSQNFDVFGTATLANKTTPKQWDMFIKAKGDNYMQDVSVEVNVTFKNIT